MQRICGDWRFDEYAIKRFGIQFSESLILIMKEWKDFLLDKVKNNFF